jgi:hypothetical protein
MLQALRHDVSQASRQLPGTLALATTAPPRLWRLTAVQRIGAAHGLWAAILTTELAVGAVADRRGQLDVLTDGYWDWGFVRILALVAACWLPMRFGWLRFRVKKSGREGWREALWLLRSELTAERIGAVLMTILLVVFTTRTHGAWKEVIGSYPWDSQIAVLDRTIHGGDAWTRLWPLFGGPVAIRTLDRIYVSWYSLFAIGLVWQAWSGDCKARRQFWIAFALMFALLGIVMAHLLASGGPVFYGGLVEGPNPFAELVRRLSEIDREKPLTAVMLQRLVWANHARGAHAFWIAMSAMPSLHVAVPVLFACALWRVGRWVSLLAWGYVLVTLIGSVQLGWHYALDGEVALLATVGLWYLSAWAVRELPE